MEHTKEPWADDGFTSIGATGSDQFNGGYFTAICQGPDKQANTRRIVACVNACAGISTENLKENLPVKELARRYNAVIRQRDELLAVLETEHGGIHYEPECAICEVVDRVKGGV